MAGFRWVAGAEDTLVVEFCGKEFLIGVASPWAFGRRADLEIDDNQFLHRRVGEFRWHDGWWITNVGRSIPIELHDAVTLSHVVLAPGAALSLPFATNVVRFQAGGSAYELVARQRVVDAPGADPEFDINGTATIAQIPLTPSQRQLIVVLAEPRLRDPMERDAPLPTNREAAARLGWELTKFNRKLDNVCDKLTRQGVRGLHGGIDSLATDRRRRLVDFAITTALVGAADLADLD